MEVSNILLISKVTDISNINQLKKMALVLDNFLFFFSAHLTMKSDSIASPYPPSNQGFFKSKSRHMSGHSSRPVQRALLSLPDGQPISSFFGVDLLQVLLNILEFF